MITIKPITIENIKACINIDTGIDPQFLAPVVNNIALSYVLPSKIPLAIYRDDHVIGFASYEKDTEPRIAYDILVIVIDKKLQGKGYGTEAMKALIEYLSEFDDCKVITLNYNRDNKRAEALYKKLGFKETGETYKANDEVIMELYVNK